MRRAVFVVAALLGFAGVAEAMVERSAEGDAIRKDLSNLSTPDKEWVLGAGVNLGGAASQSAESQITPGVTVSEQRFAWRRAEPTSNRARSDEGFILTDAALSLPTPVWLMLGALGLYYVAGKRREVG